MNKRRLVAAGVALALLAGTSTAYAASTDVSGAGADSAAGTDSTTGTDAGQMTPYLVGGQPTTQVWPAMGSLQLDENGATGRHICGASLITPWYVVTNAHCVTKNDGTVTDPATLHLRIGSNDRTAGGVLVDVAAVLPHADWDWGTGDNAVADIALLRLRRPVPARPFRIAPHLGADATVTRLLGWGLTETGGRSAPTILNQLDTKVVDAKLCAAAGIGAGEMCVENPNGTAGTCYGDSGGPALQRVTSTRWQLVGGTSRALTNICGAGPTIYTDLTYYSGWIHQVIRTGTVPPPTTGTDPTGTPAPISKTLSWIGG